MLARGEDDLSDRDHTLLANGLSDHREGLLANLTVRHDVVWIVEVEFVDFFARHELVDVDRPLTLNRDRFEFLWVELEILPLADFVPFDDVGALDFVPG